MRQTGWLGRGAGRTNRRRLVSGNVRAGRKRPRRVGQHADAAGGLAGGATESGRRPPDQTGGAVPRRRMDYGYTAGWLDI